MGLIARRHVLEESGHEVATVQDPNEALLRFQSERFDLVITDLRMPEVSGLDLIGRMRAIKPDVPLVLISGFIDALGLDEANTGADAVIQKSHAEVHQLVRTVSRLLKKGTARKPAHKQTAVAPVAVRRKS